jgi:hypothetical protein
MMTKTRALYRIDGGHPEEAELQIARVLARTRRYQGRVNISESWPHQGTPVRGARGALLGVIPWQYTGLGWRRAG